MNASGLLLAGLRRTWSQQSVAGYRPGLTAARVARELDPSWSGTPADDVTRVPMDAAFGVDGALLRERVERHFLMHIVNVEIVLRVPSSTPTSGTIHLHHTGTFRRGALVHRASGGLGEHGTALAQRVCADEAVRSALLGLDQRRCEIAGVGTAWELRIEPFGGCEVVNRMPAMRRHVRLGEAQAQALREAASALVVVLKEFG